MTALDLLCHLPRDGATFADDNEGLLVRVVRVNVADGCTGELERELSIAARQIIACNSIFVSTVQLSNDHTTLPPGLQTLSDTEQSPFTMHHSARGI